VNVLPQSALIIGVRDAGSGAEYVLGIASLVSPPAACGGTWASEVVIGLVLNTPLTWQQTLLMRSHWDHAFGLNYVDDPTTDSYRLLLASTIPKLWEYTYHSKRECPQDDLRIFLPRTYYAAHKAKEMNEWLVVAIAMVPPQTGSTLPDAGALIAPLRAMLVRRLIGMPRCYTICDLPSFHALCHVFADAIRKCGRSGPAPPPHTPALVHTSAHSPYLLRSRADSPGQGAQI
jgi:hypothetical protein